MSSDSRSLYRGKRFGIEQLEFFLFVFFNACLTHIPLYRLGGLVNKIRVLLARKRITFEGIWSEFFILRVSKLLDFCLLIDIKLDQKLDFKRSHSFMGRTRIFPSPVPLELVVYVWTKFQFPLLKKYFSNLEIKYFPGVVSGLFRRNSLTQKLARKTQLAKQTRPFCPILIVSLLFHHIYFNSSFSGIFF